MPPSSLVNVERRHLIDRFRRDLVVAARFSEGRFTPLQTSSIVQCEAAARWLMTYALAKPPRAN
jgi:hypothetical protein